MAGGWDRRARAVAGPGPSSPVGSLRHVMGMGGAGGRDAARRRRIVAAVIVFAMVLAAGATVLSLALG